MTPASLTKRTHKFFYGTYVLILTPRLQFAREAIEQIRIEIIGGANLHGAGADDKEFERVFERANAADADDRNLRAGFRSLVDAAQRNRFDARARKTACHVRDARAARFDIDGNAQQRVDQRKRVRAAGCGGARDFGDVRHVWRKLGHQQLFCRGTQRFHQALAVARIGGELAAVFHVRAGDVDFKTGDARDRIEARANCRIFFDAVADNVDEHFRGEFFEIGDAAFDERFESAIFEADGVEHAGGGFPDARGRVAFARQDAQTLRNDRAEIVEIDDRAVFAAVAEGAGGGDEGGLELQLAQLNRNVGH